MPGTIETVPVGNQPAAPGSICGFWRRILAFLIDAVVIFFLDEIILAIFQAQFSTMGRIGSLFGFCIVVLYFGISNSRINKGQTMGKKLLKICVVNKEGQFISPGRAFSRAAVFALPLLPIDIFTASPGVGQMIYTLYSLIYTGFVYFYIFNRNTRQSLHDLAAKTFVVKTSGINEPLNVNIWPKHFIIFSGIALILIAANFIPNLKNEFSPGAANHNSPAMLKLQKDLLKIDGVSNVQISEMVWRKLNNQDNDPQPPQKVLHVTIHIRDNSIDRNALANRASEVIIDENQLPDGIQSINIKVVHSYGTGISGKYEANVINIDPNNR